MFWMEFRDGWKKEMMGGFEEEWNCWMGFGWRLAKLFRF